MTKEVKPENLEELIRYQYANVAARLGSNREDAQFAPSALEQLVDGFGVDKGILEGLKAGTFASEEGIQKAIGIYAKKYEDVLGKLSFSEFYEARQGVFKSLLGDEKSEEYKKIFEEKFEGKTVGSIRKKFRQAQAIVEDDTGLFDEKKKEEAKRDIEKLQYIYNVIELIEKRNYDELKNKATKSTYKNTLTEYLRKL